MQGQTNRKIIRIVKWYSANGFIDLTLIDDVYFSAIKEQWNEDRKKILNKYHRVEKHLLKHYDAEIKLKNARRLAKVKVYDLLLKKEDLRRRMRYIFDIEISN